MSFGVWRHKNYFTLLPPTRLVDSNFHSPCNALTNPRALLCTKAAEGSCACEVIFSRSLSFFITSFGHRTFPISVFWFILTHAEFCELLSNKDVCRALKSEIFLLCVTLKEQSSVGGTFRTFFFGKAKVKLWFNYFNDKTLPRELNEKRGIRRRVKRISIFRNQEKKSPPHNKNTSFSSRFASVALFWPPTSIHSRFLARTSN